MQFARIAHATDFLYCYSIIEANRRSDFAPSPSQPNSPSRNSPVGPVLAGQPMHSELNTFFPFDPYKLPRSSGYIDSVYREWASVAIDEEEEDEEEESDAEEEGVGEDIEKQAENEPEAEVEGAIPVQARDAVSDSLNVSFGGMSISPAPLPPISVSVAMSVS